MPCAELHPRFEACSFPDDELVRGVRQGSEAHFDELYRRYFQRIYNFTYARVRDHADAEELVQETFMAVFASLEGYGGRSSLLAWIYGVAKNTVNNHLRRLGNHLERLEAAWPSLQQPPTLVTGSTPEEILLMRRYAEALDHCLRSVTPWQAQVFVLRHMDDLPISEIARRTSRSSHAVRSSLYRIKRRMIEAGEFEPESVQL